METLKRKISFGQLVLIVVALGLLLWSGITLLLNDLHEGTGAMRGLGCKEKCYDGGTPCQGPQENTCTEDMGYPRVCVGHCSNDCPDTPGDYCALGGEISCSTTDYPCGTVWQDLCRWYPMYTSCQCDSVQRFEAGCGLREYCFVQ